MPSPACFQSWICCGLVVSASLISSCAHTPVPMQSVETVVAEPEPDSARSNLVPVVRYGRYTLVELAPEAAQHDLLLQVIDVRVPEDARASVGDGLRHVLKRSGYRLCDTSPAANELFSLPLPTAHHQLGPVTLREALLTLAGSGWQLEVDEHSRRICFVGADTAPGRQSALERDSDTGQPTPLSSGEPS